MAVIVYRLDLQQTQETLPLVVSQGLPRCSLPTLSASAHFEELHTTIEVHLELVYYLCQGLPRIRIEPEVSLLLRALHQLLQIGICL